MKWQIQIAVFVALAVAASLACYFFPNASVDSEAGLIMWLPEETEKFVGEEVPISKVEAETLPSDTEYLKMSYEPEFSFEGRSAWWEGMAATLILSGTDRRSLHEPEICLGAQGWELEKRRPIVVQTEGGELEVMELQLGMWAIQDGVYVRGRDGKKQRIRAHYVYWWVSKEGSTAHTDERVMKTVLDNFLHNRNTRWGYPSVMVFVDPRDPPELGRKEALKKATDFISEYAPRFQRSLGATLNDEVKEKGKTAPVSLSN